MFSSSTVKLNSIYDDIDIERLQPNGEYDVVQTYTRLDVDPFFSFSMEYLVFGIEVRRKYSYYLINIVLPVFFMQFLGLVVFAVPTDSGEKLSFSLTLLLSLTVMMTLVAEKIPTTSLQISTLSMSSLLFYLLKTKSKKIIFIIRIKESNTLLVNDYKTKNNSSSNNNNK